MGIEKVATIIDGKRHDWEVEGEFSWGEGGVLFDEQRDLLAPRLGKEGYLIADLPGGLAERARDGIEQVLGRFGVEMQTYHQSVDAQRHQQIIEVTRELGMKDFGWDGDELCASLAHIVGTELSSHIDAQGRDFIIVRINRPDSTDFNPPHRDAYLPIHYDVVNLWIPIFGCNSDTSLPLIPGSHLIAESECYLTGAHGARIGGKTYVVPAMLMNRQGLWEMIRPPVGFGQALVFTPYLIHGAAINASDQVRISLELRLQVKGQGYHQRRR